MKSTIRTLALALPLLIAVGGCGCNKKAPSDPLAPLRRSMSTQGVPAAERALSEGQSGRADALVASARELAGAFVLPIIQDRVTQLTQGLTAKRDATTAQLGTGTWLALSSDGSVFTSVGSDPAIAFSRPFQGVPGVVAALTSGTTGHFTMHWPHDSNVPAMVDVVAAQSEGAIAGALVIVTPFAAEAERVRDAVRRRGGPLATVGVCLRGDPEFACTDVPEAAQRAVTMPAFGGQSAGVADFAEAGVRGIFASGAPIDGKPRPILWSASRTRH